MQHYSIRLLSAVAVTGVAAVLWLAGSGRLTAGGRTASAQEALTSAVRTRALRTPLRVRVAPVLEEAMKRTCTASGVVSAFRRATVAAEVTGRVVARQVEPGDRVEAEQALILLDATRLQLAEERARATLRTREVDLAEARRELERGDRLFDDGALSTSRRDALRFAVDRAESALTLARVALRSARKNLADATVRAPFAGSVEEVQVDVGDHVRPGTPVATMVDLSWARIRAGVTAAEAAGLAPRAKASVVFADLGGVVIDAEVRSVARVAEESSGTYTVELWIDNPQQRLREGMVAEVRFPMATQGRKPVVPRAALTRGEGGLVVFVVERHEGESRAVARPVRTGHSNGEKVEILDGVSAGEEVVIDGLFALRDGAPVSVEKASFVGSGPES